MSINARKGGAFSARRKEHFIMVISTINDYGWFKFWQGFVCMTGSFRNVNRLTIQRMKRGMTRDAAARINTCWVVPTARPPEHCKFAIFQGFLT